MPPAPASPARSLTHSGRGFYRRPLAPPGGRGRYSPVRVDAVVVDHGFQRVRVGCKRGKGGGKKEEKKREGVREGFRRAGDKREAGN